MSAARGGPKSSLALFRDCLRLVAHMAGRSSPKAKSLRAIVAAQFRAHRHETDAAKLHVLTQGCGARPRARAPRPLRCERETRAPHTPAPPSLSAEKGLSNYLIYHTSKTDKKVAAHAADVGQYEDDEAGNLVRK